MQKSTQQILKKFYAISAIPRESGNETAIRRFIIDWAKRLGFKTKTDKAGNLVVTTGPSPVILQGHLDMVCEKSSSSKHDFKNDPIKIIKKNGWLKARSTTLGADNGIALAYMMQLAEEGKKLQLLFTVEEETGLIGAMRLGSGMLTGKYLINLDSEDEGIFTIGCAGGIDIEGAQQIEMIKNSHKYAYKISVNDLKGGHSGVDINKNIPNAIKVLVKKLKGLKNIRIAHINGGSKRNAIPRDAYAIITTDEKLRLPLVKPPVQTFSDIDSARIIDLLTAIPHGIIAMWSKTLPKTSCNLAIVRSEKGILSITSSCRSFSQKENEASIQKIKDIFTTHNFLYSILSGYIAWEPESKNSTLIKTTISSYKKLFKKTPQILPMHAGLECGIIKSKYMGLEAISLGPNIKNPHSPDEKIEIKSIENTWKLLEELINRLSEKGKL